MLLTACGGWGGPAQAVVEQALNLRLQQTQQILRQVDILENEDFRGSRVNIQRVQAVTIDGEKAYRVEGDYTLRGRYHNRRYRQAKNPFELYLSSTEAGDWLLLQPQYRASESSPEWQPIPLNSSS